MSPVVEVAEPPPPAPCDHAACVRVGPGEGTVDIALGAQVLPYVGDQADLGAGDVVLSEGVRISASALTLEVRHPSGFGAGLRVEEGVVHAGGLESAEATVGWASPRGVGELAAGRDDLVVTLDRQYEPEDRGFAWAPALSRIVLPVHANGVFGAAAWPDRGVLRGGAAWTTTTADAPWWFGRLAVHPLGALPDREDGAADGWRLQLGGGAAYLPSASLGDRWLVTADAVIRYRAWAVSGAWVVDHADRDRSEWWVAGFGRLWAWPRGELRLGVRSELVTDLVVGESSRWVGASRLTTSLDCGHVDLWTEGWLSRETPTPADGVVATPRDRLNDLVSVGVTWRTGGGTCSSS